MREISEQGRLPFSDVNALADMAVEIAIGAFGDAERPVDIERQRPRPVIRHRRRSQGFSGQDRP